MGLLTMVDRKAEYGEINWKSYLVPASLRGDGLWR